MDPHRLNSPAVDDATETDDWEYEPEPEEEQVAEAINASEQQENDGFVIPSFSVKESDLGDWEVSQASAPQLPPKQPSKDTENIYLGPHGAPPSQAKKQEETSATTGYRDKNIKAKEADAKVFGTGRDNKASSNLRDYHRHGNVGYHVKEPYKRSTLPPHRQSSFSVMPSSINSLTK